MVWVLQTHVSSCNYLIVHGRDVAGSRSAGQARPMIGQAPCTSIHLRTTPPWPSLQQYRAPFAEELFSLLKYASVGMEIFSIQ